MRCRDLGMAGILIAAMAGCATNQGWKLAWFNKSKDETAVKAEKPAYAKADSKADKPSFAARLRGRFKAKDKSATGTEEKQLVKTKEGYKAVPVSDVKLAKADPEGPEKRTPRPSTCLKAGHCFEQMGDKSEVALLKKKKYNQARRAYEQALEIDPNYAAAIVSLARLNEKEGQNEMAVKMYKKGLELYPQHPALWFELGMCWGRQKEWDSSVACLKKALTIDPENTQYSNYVGWALARAGHEQESLEHFRRTAGEAKANYNLALMMHHMGNQEKCEQYLQASLKADPKLVDAQVLQAQLVGPKQPTAPVPPSGPPIPDIRQVDSKD